MAQVLIVDDTEIIRKALELAVRRMGHSAMSAGDAGEALTLARERRPDLALLDYRMEGTTGAELYHDLREELGASCPRVVFVSATPSDEVARAVEPIGPAAGYLKKPFQLDDLVRTVDQALR
jgi:two-component system OmpR family response regulator